MNYKIGVSLKNTIIFLGVLLLGMNLHANDETDKAIGEVQDMMQKPEFRENASKGSKEASAIVENVKTISGGKENEDEIYKMAAEILGNMKGKSPEEMTKILEEAKRNPEAFVQTWSPEQKEKLKKLSERLPAANKAKP